MARDALPVGWRTPWGRVGAVRVRKVRDSEERVYLIVDERGDPVEIPAEVVEAKRQEAPRLRVA